MTIYDFKVGETYVYLNFPFFFDKFKVREVTHRIENKKAAIDTEIGPFFFYEKTTTSMDGFDAICFGEDKKSFITNYDKTSLLFLKKIMCEKYIKDYIREHIRSLRNGGEKEVINMTFKQLMNKLKRLLKWLDKLDDNGRKI